MTVRRKRNAMMCEHANEAPATCRCPRGCYCKANTCKPVERIGEEFLLRVCWSATPNHLVRAGEVMADVGVALPEPPPTDAEMQAVTFAAKMELLRQLKKRKRPRR